jgi:hypothetical protein
MQILENSEKLCDLIFIKKVFKSRRGGSRRVQGGALRSTIEAVTKE